MVLSKNLLQKFCNVSPDQQVTVEQGQMFIHVLGLSIAGNHCDGTVRLLDEIIGSWTVKFTASVEPDGAK